MYDTAPSSVGDDESTTLDTDVEHPEPGVALLTVAGEVDTLTAPLLAAALDRLLACDDPVLAADLSGVSFLASSGLAVLIQAAHRAEGTLRLIVPGRAVRRPLEITGTDQLFDLHTDRATALATVHDEAHIP